MSDHQQHGADPNHHTQGWTRREFVGAGALGAAALGLGVGAHAGQPTRRAGARPRNVILMISDGMSPGVLELAEHFSLARRATNSVWGALVRDPRATTSLMSSASANGPVTDSAAAGTAFSVGKRGDNGSLCVLPDGTKPTPLGLRLKAKGKAVGLVTTTHLAHATPAAFLVNHPSRHEYGPIAIQMLARRADVMFGGGAEHFTPSALASHAPDLDVRRTASELERPLADAPTIGIFSDDHMSYELDRPAEQPSLSAMTHAALKSLQRHDAGFFLMVEGGRVDHAAHANDILGLLHDQIAFDDAVQIALRFAEADGDTLVIVTSDHANANPGLTHYAEKGAAGFERLSRGSMSFEAMYGALGRRPTTDALVELVERERELTLTGHDVETLRRAIEDELVNGFRDADKLSSAMGAVLANHYSVAFCSPNHTSDHVVLTAIGPRSESLPRLGHITDLHAWMTDAMGLA